MNLAKITIQKINQPNLKIEVYRVFEEEDKHIENFYLLTDVEKQKYHFVTIDQDKYFEANFNTEEIVLYDIDKTTYETSTKFTRESVGVQYHSFLSDDLLSNEPVIEKAQDSFVLDIYCNTNVNVNNDVHIKYYLVVKKVFMQSVQPETREETISVSGFTYRYNQDNYKLTLYIPGTYEITINRVKENNRLVQYGDKYYYVLPALDFKSNNVKREIQAYCKKLGGSLMIINTKQELALANYLAQTFTNRDNPKYGYVYCDIILKPFNPQKTATIKMTDISSVNLEDLKYAKLTEMKRTKNSDVRFLVSSGSDSNPSIGYCDPSVNLPFIIEFDKTDFETKSNALLKNLYENSELIKFGNFNADGMPGSDFCVLPENIKKREYQYQNGYLIGNYNRHCLLCFLTKQKFVGYNHAATFSSPATSHEPDDDCIVMVISALDSEQNYKYDTLSFIVKLNNDQTHCGVPMNVKCALVYNVFLSNQQVLKEDLTFTTNSLWNNFKKGMAIKAIKTAEKIDIYRTDMRNNDDEFDKIDPEQSEPVISMTFAEIESLTGVDFSEGYLGYGNISQAETWIKNIDIVAEDADIMNDLKSQSMEYIAATATTNVTLHANAEGDEYISESYQDVIYFDGEYSLNSAEGLYDTFAWSNKTREQYIQSIPHYKQELVSENYTGTPSLTDIDFPVSLMYHAPDKKVHLYSHSSSLNACYMHCFGTYDQAVVYNKLPATYNDKLIFDWTLRDPNVDVKDSIKLLQIDGNVYLSIPNIFKESIANNYKTFTYDARHYTIYYEEKTDENSGKTYYVPIESKTKYIDRYQKEQANIDVICINYSIWKQSSGGGKVVLSRTCDDNTSLRQFNIPVSNVAPNLNKKTILMSETNQIFYYKDFNEDNILIQISDQVSDMEYNTSVTINLAGYQEVFYPNKVNVYNMHYPTNQELSRWSPKFHAYLNVSNLIKLSWITGGIELPSECFIKEELEDGIKYKMISPLGISYKYTMSETNNNTTIG